MRAAIRRATRDALRRQYLELGRRLVSAHFGRVNLEFEEDSLKTALPRLAAKNTEDVRQVTKYFVKETDTTKDDLALAAKVRRSSPRRRSSAPTPLASTRRWPTAPAPSRPSTASRTPARRR